MQKQLQEVQAKQLKTVMQYSVNTEGEYSDKALLNTVQQGVGYLIKDITKAINENKLLTDYPVTAMLDKYTGEEFPVKSDTQATVCGMFTITDIRLNNFLTLTPIKDSDEALLTVSDSRNDELCEIMITYQTPDGKEYTHDFLCIQGVDADYLSNKVIDDLGDILEFLLKDTSVEVFKLGGVA